MQPSGVRRPLNVREELVNALENVMPADLVTMIWDYEKLPSKVPEEFVNAISHVVGNDLTLIIWEYVMCPALDLCRFCHQPREVQNGGKFVPPVTKIGKKIGKKIVVTCAARLV
jgi:hypothetical protein